MKKQGLLAMRAAHIRVVSMVIVVCLALVACAGASDTASVTLAPAVATRVASTTTTSLATTTQPATTVAATSTTTTVPETSTTVVLSEEAEAAQAVMDRWIAAWNAGDEQAVRDVLSPDFSYNDSHGVDWVDGALDQFVGFIEKLPEIIRISEAVENESGTFTWTVEFWGTASTRYPAEVLDLDVAFDDATILHMDEHRHRDG